MTGKRIEPADPEEGNDFQRLPSGKLLYGWLQSTADELNCKWNTRGALRSFPILFRVWSICRAAARATLRRDPAHAAASELLRRWDELDRQYGSPRERAWELSCTEAADRIEVLDDYLHDSGLLGFQGAEPSAPTLFFSPREQTGE